MMRWLLMTLAAAALGVLSGPAEFAEHFSRGKWRPARHLRFISDAVADAIHSQQGAIILIEAPPQHGKSELVSHWLPAWYHTLAPDEPVALAAYEATMARNWGRIVRDEHDAIGVVSLEQDSQAADYWHTDAGGSFVTAGVGGPITGKRAKLFIIDDPIKNAEEADSELMRQKIWDWWQAVAWTRRQPGTVYVIMHTRWHEDDLVGRILELAKQEAAIARLITRVSLPALAERDDSSNQATDHVRTLRLGRAEGEALWPERYPADETADGLLTTKAGLPSARWWIALFQQRPSASEGNEIKRAWWRYYDELPVALEQFDYRAISVDCAFRDTKDSAYVVLLAGGAYGAQRYVFDVDRRRMDFVETLAALREMYARWLPHVVLIEAKGNGDAVLSTMRTEIPVLLGIDPHGGKESRARAGSPQIAAGNVLLPKAASWTGVFVEEHAAMPRGKYWDQIDAMSQFLNFLLHWQVNHASALTGPDRVMTEATRKRLGGVDGGKLFSIRPALRRSV